MITARPEAIDYFCRNCEALRIHVLSEDAHRYFCGTCDRSVAAIEVAITYGVLDDPDPDIMIIMDPHDAKQRLTEARERDTIERPEANSE